LSEISRMRDSKSAVRAICKKEGLACGEIQRLHGGQVNRVLLVDGKYVVRMGAREDAFERLKHESEVLASLEGLAPVPKVLAFGQEDGQVYQIQEFAEGQKLYTAWKGLSAQEQETITAEIGAALQVFHSRRMSYFGYARADTPRHTHWGELLAARLQKTLDEYEHLGILTAPGFLEMAADYFEEHKDVLEAGSPTLVHGDLTMVNILVNNGHVSAILDMEYSMQAPADYELWTMEAFCLYPNDWAEEDNEVFCSADFAGLFPLLQKHYPALFETPNLRERINLYHLEACLGSHLSWRKDNMSTLPPEGMAGKNFYMARITNFIFAHGARMFYG